MNRVMRLGLFLALLAFLHGCLHSEVDENWGSSYGAQRMLQRANPDAPITVRPLNGLDPETARRVALRYYGGQENQRQREAPSVTTQE